MNLSDNWQVNTMQHAEILRRAAIIIDSLAKTKPHSRAVTLEAVSMILRQTSRELFVEVGKVLTAGEI